jgi:hypothetical protein
MYRLRHRERQVYVVRETSRSALRSCKLQGSRALPGVRLASSEDPRDVEGLVTHLAKHCVRINEAGLRSAGHRAADSF